MRFRLYFRMRTKEHGFLFPAEQLFNANYQKYIQTYAAYGLQNSGISLKLMTTPSKDQMYH